MKKRMTALLLAMSLAAVSLAGCGSTGKDSGDSKKKADDDVYHVGVIQLVEHEALDAATEGFQDALKEKLGDKVVFDVQNAQGEETNCATICTKFVNDDVDLIMANATQALTSAATATPDIPIVGTSVTDFVTTGTVESNDKPGTNVTGTSDLAPIDQQIALLKRLVPDAKTVGILYCSSEANSVYQAEEAQKELEKEGIKVEIYTVADSNDIQQVVTKAADNSDAIYIPTDNTIASNMEIVKNVTVPEKVPVIAGEENMCAVGGLATLSISYYNIGYNAGLMAYDILVNGKDPAEMPIQYADEITLKYNAEIASELGIQIPDDMVAIEKED
ncbi:MAG: ABC transporter substrate-binding protein [Lachnospiraceae bacterium]|nr:ABC transporter substrate-binding protein [Lachnospiraceae bacterium]MDD7378610.1 ABC transporter substrate-binding protein [Lachnospiraceae bacterium]MDY4617671.1 ABC transporter substrate-binding protein [Lachnospiraceae bacterium]